VLRERLEARRGRVDVALAGQQEDRAAEGRELGGRRNVGDVDVPRIEGEPDQREGGDALVADRLPQRDEGPERPPAHQDRSRRVLTNAVDRCRDVACLRPPRPVCPAGSHHTAKVETEDDEATRRQVRPDRPQDRMIPAPAVAGVRMANHRARDRLALREAQVALQRDMVFGREADGRHVRRW
jgi:hypothetical protein